MSANQKKNEQQGKDQINDDSGHKTNTGIGEKNESTNKKSVDRPNNVLMDVYGVITSWEFRKSLNEFVKNNILEFMTKKIKTKDKTIKHIINKLREQAVIDRSADIPVPLIEEATKGEDVMIKSVVTNVLWQMENKNTSCQLQLNTLFNEIWADGYTSSKLKVHVFKDVKKTLEHWRFHQYTKIYAYASGPKNGQKLFLSSTEDGDLTKYFANYLNSSGGYKYDSNKFKVVISALRESQPKNLLYLTDDPKKARAAIEVGMRAIVVIRPGNDSFTAEELKGLITINSLDELDFKEDPSNPPPCC